ncbi:phage tail tape-measure protein [Rhodobacter veldkampii DSM 11550]|uniref:Phage tail tape-measure protein n=1 Tax=Phaeovulum veldkampii DSM 11550 TaxID=1185920 RepID=A0A2T4JFW6_9RHOB|nr:phage tail tape measure C-terminal domain-containing protein [Phaeovulum veldkampii]MBK5946486.1 phage tail tape-measure protein [Phaeovulum veldkampii DSM 11550]PTE16733.1 phage tail tape-measure protein [Phaeovulum veldkampii DSM 11550]TDQ54611.1 lambda family phage tail tape measure protein [Phaeovulum veldkampii DSM 11550]
MAEKRVSVRLAAVGGRQVRAELEGVGDAGARGFGRLSREMEAANTRLAAFARRASVAMGAAAAATTAALAVIVRTTAQSAAQIQQFAQVANATPEVFQRWSAASATVGIEQEKLADILKDVNDRVGDFLQTGGGPMADFFENIAPQVGVTAEQFARLSGPEALQLYVTSLERAGLGQQEMTFYLEAMASDATRLIPLLASGGAEMKRLGERAAGFGTVLDREALAALRRTEIALIGVGQVFQGMRVQIGAALAPAVTAMAEAFLRLAETGGPINRAFTAVLDNLTRLGTYAATFAAFLAGRWVAGMAAAALSVRGLATALVLLRGALIRTGIGALIVGAGELIYQFTRLVSSVGGVGNALSLLGQVGAEAWDRLSLTASAAWARVEAGWARTQAAIYDGLQGTTEAVTGWANATIGAFQGGFDAVVAIWSALPQTIGDFAYQAANGLIDGVEAMLNAVVGRINRFIEGLNSALSLLPDWAVGEGGARIGTLDPVDLGGIENPYAGAAAATGTAAAEAFQAAMGRTYVEAPDLFGGMADAARGRASGYDEAAGMLSDAANRPRTAWDALKAAVTSAGSEGSAALDGTAAAADRTTAALGETADAAGQAGDATGQAGGAATKAAEEAATGWRAVAQSLADYARDAMDWGKGLGQSLVSAFQSAESAFRTFVTTGKLDFKSLVSSILADLAVIAARRFILGPIANALSGALGGLGGGGGIFAGILHQGGIVGGATPMRMVPAMAFAAAPRMHEGGWAGLRPDEVPAILQRGERVLSRREAAAYGAGATGRDATPVINVTIQTRDAESFRQSRTQVASDIARAVALGRRGM